MVRAKFIPTTKNGLPDFSLLEKTLVNLVAFGEFNLKWKPDQVPFNGTVVGYVLWLEPKSKWR